MRTTLALLLLMACDKTQDYKVEPVDSTPMEAEEPDLDGDGYSELTGDCDDDDAAVHPDANDGCDGVDNDCDLQTDEDAAWSTWYQDQDEDGYGDPDRGEDACAQPAGTVADGSDCNDHNAAVSPAAEESCDGMDDDCDGESDEAGATGEESWYADVDGDGFGDALDELVSCAAPEGYLEDATDCDDGDGEINPAALELCDEVDNDCNGEVDEDSAVDAVEWYEDLDGDGYGSAALAYSSCSQPAGYTSSSTDCNDTDDGVSPGSVEIEYSTVDEDCDGATDEIPASGEDDIEMYAGRDVSSATVDCDLEADRSPYASFDTPRVYKLKVIRVYDSTNAVVSMEYINRYVYDFTNPIYESFGLQFAVDSVVDYESAAYATTISSGTGEFAGLRAAFVTYEGSFDSSVIYVFVVPSMEGSVAGIATFPGTATYPGVVVTGDSEYYVQLLGHELGHYFGLYHTHQNTYDGADPELVDGTNCSSSGDLLCDTPADPAPTGTNVVGSGCTFSCVARSATLVEPVLGTCGTDSTGTTYVPDPYDVMSYYNCGLSYNSELAYDQLSLTQCVLENVLTNLSYEDDNDGDGYSVAMGDCDDNNAELNPADHDDDTETSCDGDCDDLDDTLNNLDLDSDTETSCDGDCDDLDDTLNNLDLDSDTETSCDGDCDDLDDALNNLDLDSDTETSCDGDCDDEDDSLNELDLDADSQTSCDGDCDDDDPDVYDMDLDGDNQTPCDTDCDDTDGDIYYSFKHVFRYTGSSDNWITGFGTALEAPLLGDVDGDGMADAVGFYADGDWYVAQAQDDSDPADGKGDSFASEDRWIEGFGDGSDEQFLADVDGDWLADAVIFRGATGVWAVALSTGRSFTGMSNWVSDSGTDHGHGELSDHVMMGDVDGDGMADIVSFYRNDGESYSNDPDGDGIIDENGNGVFDEDGDGDADNEWWVAYSTGSDFGNGVDGSSAGFHQWIPSFGSDSVAEFVADVDGDFCADAVIMESDGDWKYVSGGCGSPSSEKDLMVRSSGEAADLILIGDVNGDLMADAGAFYVSTNDADLERVANYIGGTFESDGVAGDDHAAAGLTAVMKVGLNDGAEFDSSFISQYWIEDFGAEANRVFLVNVDETYDDPMLADLVAFYASTGTWKVARAVGWECSDEDD